MLRSALVLLSTSPLRHGYKVSDIPHSNRNTMAISFRNRNAVTSGAKSKASDLERTETQQNSERVTVIKGYSVKTTEILSKLCATVKQHYGEKSATTGREIESTMSFPLGVSETSVLPGHFMSTAIETKSHLDSSYVRPSHALTVSKVIMLPSSQSRSGDETTSSGPSFTTNPDLPTGTIISPVTKGGPRGDTTRRRRGRLTSVQVLLYIGIPLAVASLLATMLISKLYRLYSKR